MAVKIRMMRLGRRHRPFFRINAMDSRTPRNGRILEKLGHFDPLEKNPDKQLVLDLDKVKAWIDKGAEVSDTMTDILRTKGIITKASVAKKIRRDRAKAIAKAKGVPFTEANKIELKKAAEKAAEDAKVAAEAAAAAKKEAEEKAAAKAKAKEEEAAAKAKAKEEAAAAKAAEAEAPAGDAAE
jgi:small subunit ribosomal protein S16